MSEKELNKLNETIKEAISLINSKHAGANLEDAKNLLMEAGDALKSNSFQKAIDLACKAQLAARPTTEYLLSNAKKLASEAREHFSSKDYEEAISLWNKSKEEYGRASELAKEREEAEIVEQIDEVEIKINESISKAEISIDNRDMHKLVNMGNNALEEANKHFEDKQFDQSKNVYEDAQDKFKEALKLAEKRDFSEDIEKIKEALKSIKSGIVSVQLSKGDAMLQEADKDLNDKNFSNAENTFFSALEYLDALKIKNKKEIDEMLAIAREGLINAKLKQGKEKMQGADQFFSENKYYDAKEAYREARDYLETVNEEATGYKLTKLVEELNILLQTCNQNISTITRIIVNIDDVKPEIIKVENLGKATAEFKTATQKPLPVSSAMQKLMEKYTELIPLGGGGFADVYKGTKKDGTLVAVKVPRNLNEKAEEIFFREIRTWENLNHRNIAKLINPYLRPEPHIEIEYVEGGNLEKALKSGSFDVDKACRIAFDIAGGLEYAHSKYVIHGDINPRNILLNSINEAKIADFGLSKIATSSSEIPGYTLAYASKEQVEKGIANEKTDSYQLGLTLYVLLTGNNPYDTGSRFETEERIRDFTPDPPSVLNHKCSELDNFIMRCLSKSPNERPSIRGFREFIYKFIKQNYNKSLHLTEVVEKVLAMDCSLAMLATKHGDIGECLRALRHALSKVRDPGIRNELNNLIEQVEFRYEKEIAMEPLLDKMEIILKKVEWEG